MFLRHGAAGHGAQGHGGINGPVAMSALGSGCACPTAFVAHCPRRRIQRAQVLWRVPALTCPEWLGCGCQDCTGLGVHAGQGHGGGGDDWGVATATDTATLLRLCLLTTSDYYCGRFIFYSAFALERQCACRVHLLMRSCKAVQSPGSAPRLHPLGWALIPAEDEYPSPCPVSGWG